MKYFQFALSVLFLIAAVYFAEKEPSASNQEPSAVNQEPSASNQKPSASNQKPTAIKDLTGQKVISTSTAIADYSEARSILWQSLYANGGNTLYCGESFNSQQRNGFNVEHVFPMSWVTNSLDCGTRNQCRNKSVTFNKIEADLHNLYPSRSDVNQARSSFAFGQINGEQREFGKDCDFEVSEQQRLAEPAPRVRGEVARSMFYMAYQYRQYGLQLFSKQQRLLLEWHQNDAPSEHERARNDKIEQLQGNRNPFIDDPAQLDKLVADGYFS